VFNGLYFLYALHVLQQGVIDKCISQLHTEGNNVKFREYCLLVVTNSHFFCDYYFVGVVPLNLYFGVKLQLPPFFKFSLKSKITWRNAEIFSKFYKTVEAGIAQSAYWLGNGLDNLGFGSWQEQDILLFYKTSRPFLRPAKPPSQWVPGSFPGGKVAAGWSWPLPSSADVKNEWSYYFVLAVYLRVVCREKFAFYETVEVLQVTRN
jgi:hypothetical protein